MSAREMYQEYLRLLDEKGLSMLDGINAGSNKRTLQNGIDCLNSTDEQMDEYLEVIKTEYPAIYETIKGCKNYKTNPFKRIWVYNNARMILRGC